MPDLRAKGISQRYELLEMLGAGGMGAVYVARDRLANRRVALKRIRVPVAPRTAEQTVPDIAGLPTLARGHPDSGSRTEHSVVVINGGTIDQGQLRVLRLALANEFRTLATLRHPHIVGVLDYGFARDGQPYFTMELLEHGQSLSTASSGSSHATKVGLLLQILQALSYLHRHGVLHRDLKPANILCVPTPMGPRVKLLDFGLAVLQRHCRAEIQEISGTLGYIAPEVLLGQTVTAHADLYSFGVVAFELLAGRELWPPERDSMLIAAALGRDPVLDDVDLPPRLRKVLAQLLCRNPAARYATAEETASALAAAVDLPQPAESAELRDCVLGSAELVGREVELGQLLAALRQVLHGHGQLILLAGESGIGKSRLLEELRPQALIEGTRVLAVQAKSDRGTDIGLYADALRTLCLDAPPPSLTMSVLKGVLADLPTLLAQEIPDPPELDAPAARLRLRVAVESTLLAVQQPTVLVLEDIHWAGADSIEILRRVAEQLADRPLLIVASYRSDERPDLPTELPSGQVISLRRLLREDISQLSASILGEGRGGDRLLDWLTAQSEGNTFFITEVMRAVAEEAGSLDAIGEAVLPQGILTGGMDAVLRRRLGYVPDWAQPLLRLAAVAGRQLDLEVLRVLDRNLEQWLRVAAAAGVLEPHEPSWRFSHDKLRERVLADLRPGERPGLHRQLAGAIERTYADLRPLTATLAFHYEQGEVLDKAATYAELAGESAVRRGALAEALSLLHKARALQDRLGLPPLDKVHTEMRLAETLYGLSQYQASQEAVGQALSFLGQPLPGSKQAMSLGILREAARKLLQALLPVAGNWGLRPPPIGRSGRSGGSAVDSGPEDAVPAELSLHLLHADLSVYLGRMDGLVYSALHLANLEKQYGDTVQGFPFSQGMQFLLSLAPTPWTRRGRRPPPVMPTIGDARLRLHIWRSEGVLQHYRGEQEIAQVILEQTQMLAEQLGDITTERMALTYRFRAAGYLGAYDVAQHCSERLLATARLTGDTMWQYFARMCLGLCHMRRGELAQAAASLEPGLLKIPAEHYPYWAMLRALCLAKQGDIATARELLVSVLPGLEQTPINIVLGIDAYQACAETALYLRQHAGTTDERRAAMATYRSTIKILRRYTALSAHGRAALFLHEGCAAWLQGHHRLAAWLFRRARRSADQYQMRPNAALAACWLGRTLPGAAGTTVLREGLAQLRQLGARGDVDEVTSWG